MSQFRKFAIALIALSTIAGTTVAANGIEILTMGIEILSPNEYIAHTQITNAPANAMAFGIWNDGEQDHIVSATPINPNGLTGVYFPMNSPTNKVAVGFMTSNGIEILAFGWIEDELAWN